MSEYRDAVFALVAVLAGCGGAAPAPAPPLAPVEPTAPAPAPAPDLDALYAACGVYTGRDAAREGLYDKEEADLTEEDYAKLEQDPAWQQPKDVGACLDFMRATAEAERVETRVIALEVAYALCSGAAANGEACYLQALALQVGIWKNGEHMGSVVTVYLEHGCELGHAPSCALLDDPVDVQGRTWSIER